MPDSKATQEAVEMVTTVATRVHDLTPAGAKALLAALEDARERVQEVVDRNDKA